jgi:hypothetical protein
VTWHRLTHLLADLLCWLDDCEGSDLFADEVIACEA